MRAQVFSSVARRVAIALVAAAAVGSLFAGCGTTFDVPFERRGVRTIPGAGTYQMITTRSGLAGIKDILLTPSGELFLLFQDPVSKTGRVQEFPPGLTNPLSTSFPGLLNPGALCFGANKVFVLDQGDTAMARTTDSAGVYVADCGPIGGFSRPIRDLDRYWHVREYALNGGRALSAFTDTAFAWVNGIAADQQGRVYVSGVIMFCDVDPFDLRRRRLTYRYRVHRYERGPSAGSVIGENWRRDSDWVIREGTGIGFAIDPQGMQWAMAGGEALYFADFGNSVIQRFADPNSFGSSFMLVEGGGVDSAGFQHPVDVAVDPAGYVYVADTGNRRVLRFGPDAAYVQRIDIEPDENQLRLDNPLAVAASNDQVYVADPGRAEVVRYRRRK